MGLSVEAALAANGESSAIRYSPLAIRQSPFAVSLARQESRPPKFPTLFRLQTVYGTITTALFGKEAD
ncbi:hypothetical protein [Fervidibacter sacchari]